MKTTKQRILALEALALEEGASLRNIPTEVLEAELEKLLRTGRLEGESLSTHSAEAAVG